jgi:hypothetical protein
LVGAVGITEHTAELGFLYVDASAGSGVVRNALPSAATAQTYSLRLNPSQPAA